MAKPDFSKDYYADLELPATADVTEIKKQFKKLALKYHPDRNPGTGNEFNMKFQTIQAAHEILSNPDTKSRYDAQRSRGKGYPTASGVKGNPWSNVSSQFPTPPQRGSAKPPKPPPRPTPSASSRYSSFGVPPSAKTTREDPQTRYQAWENMKGKSGSTRRTQAPPPPAPTARTASQRQKAEASFGNRKSGYVPQSPVGDEPPVSNSNYFSSNRHTTMFPETPVKPRRTSHMDSGAPFRDPIGDERQSTPYRANGGEKLNPFDGATNLNRAKSTRENARAAGQEAENSPRRHKSSEDMSPSQNGPAFGAAAGATFAARMNQRPTGEQGPGKPASPSAHNEFPWNAAATNGQNPQKPPPPTAKPEHTTYAPDSFYTPALSSFAYPLSAQNGAGVGAAFVKKRASPPKHNIYYGQDASVNSSTSSSNSPATMSKLEELQLKVLQDLLERQPELVAAVDKAAQSLHEQQSKRADTNFATSFSFPRDNMPYEPTTSDKPFSSSAEKINTSFVTEDHAGTDYQFNAGGPSQGSAAPEFPTPRRTQSGSRLRRRPTAQESRQARPAQSAETLASDRGETKSSGFNNEDWQEQFSSLNFAPPTVGVQGSASPTKGTRQSRKPRPVQRTMGSAGIVDEDDTSSDDRSGPPTANGPLPVHVESPNAMDIDPPPSAPSNGARNINVEPSRPDWRAGDVTGGMPEPPARPPKQPLPAFSANNAAGSEDTDDFFTNMADLKNVAPLAASGTGFESLNDLKNDLPFQSKASSRLHLNESSTKKKSKSITFPRTPIAPRPPPTLVVPSLTPTSRAWEDYVTAFNNYLREWQLYNARFVDHFMARRGQIETQHRTEGAFTWLYTRGDAGIDEYMDWMEEDEVVRTHWTNACNEHAQKTAEFRAYRKAYLDKLT